MKVAVLMGGASEERDVSLASGVEVAHALREAGCEVVAVDTAHGVLDPEREAALREAGVSARPPDQATLRSLDEGDTIALVRDPALADVDVFFLALHGGAGEDGTVQALLDVAGVVYTGSDRLGCSLAMDKEVSKRLLRDAGIPTPRWLAGQPSPDEVARTLGLPVIVKASGGGSSLRLLLAHDRRELAEAMERARGFEDVVVYERYIRGRELTVGIVGDDALAVGEIIPEHEIFDYECKYQAGMAREIFPAEVPVETADRVKDLGLRCHRALRLRDYSRVDFMLDETGTAWCLEANSLPGMTANSLLPKSGIAAGIGFAELCRRIVDLAGERAGL